MMMNLINIALNKETLKNFHPLNIFNDDDINLLNKHASINNLDSKEILFREGTNDSDIIFLLNGSLRLSTKSGESFILDAESDQAKHPIANLKPRRFSAKVYSDNAAVAKIPVHIFDQIMSSHKDTQISLTQAEDLNNTATVLDSDWMMAMVKTPLFRKLPPRHLEKLFESMEEISYKAGDTVVTQGEVGDYFYLIKKGECLVSRHNGTKEITLAQMEMTDTFGEEALLTKSRRNATVRMLTDGQLMRLSKDVFQRLMQTPIVHWIDNNEASMILKQGAVKIDISNNQSNNSQLEDAVKMPLFLLRNQMKKLSRKRTYLLFCDDGEQGAVASYLFSLRGLNTYVLRGGVNALAS